ncbi:MAG: signal peptidase I [Clostridia bacterium]
MKIENKSTIKNILEWIICILIALILALAFKYYIGTPTQVRKTSMFPTLKENDRLILSRVSRITHKLPKYGDIITFEAPSKLNFSKSEINQSNPIAIYDTDKNIFSKFVHNVLEIGKDSYIKRVIALPGDSVKIENGKVFVNDVELEENYLEPNVHTYIQKGFDNFIVPENYIFAMGDNREHSIDCRNFGCIPLEKIEGTAILRFWPFDKVQKL